MHPTTKTVTHWLKNNNVMEFSDKWIELEIIMLSEMTQAQKDKHGMCSLISEY